MDLQSRMPDEPMCALRVTGGEHDGVAASRVRALGCGVSFARQSWRTRTLPLWCGRAGRNLGWPFQSAPRQRSCELVCCPYAQTPSCVPLSQLLGHRPLLLLPSRRCSRRFEKTQSLTVI